MREIKFRFYDKEAKEMQYLSLHDLGEDNIWFDGETDMWSVLYDSHKEQEKFVVMQYTGLKDKNGKEIYEGDIVSSILKLDNGIMLRRNTDIVEWNEEECSFMLTKQVRHFHKNLELEVIGNIYNNPELLKEE